MHSLLKPRIAWKALAAVLLVVFALPADAQTAPKRKRSTAAKTKKASAKSKAAAEQRAAQPSAVEPPVAVQAAPEPPAPAPPPPAAEPPAAKPPAAKSSVAARSAPARAAPEAPASAPARVAGVPPAPTKLRIGVGMDLFTESSRMTGEQAINSSRRDESFDYKSSSFLSATLLLSVPAPISSERARIGGGIRLFGNYGAGGNQVFGFGMLNQAFITGEYGLPVARQFEAVFGARGGLSLLFPGREFSAEINRLQEQGVDVWSVPRIGWLLGLSVGARRQMSEHILLRGDLTAQYDKLLLFSTSQDIDGLQFNKDWSTSGIRLGLTLGIEFAL